MSGAPPGTTPMPVYGATYSPPLPAVITTTELSAPPVHVHEGGIHHHPTHQPHSHTIHVPPVIVAEAGAGVTAGEGGKVGIPGGAYAPFRQSGHGVYPPVPIEVTDRIFGRICPARWLASPWWTPSYIGDYILLVLIWIGAGIAWFWYDDLHREYHVPPPGPNGVGYAWYDNVYTYPYDSTEAISPALSVVFCFLCPIIVFVIFAICLRSGHDFHHACLGLAIAVGIGYIIQIPITRATGIFRPDYLARVATGDKKQIEEGRRSFPSGHAMIAFCGYGYLTFYFMGKLKLLHAHYGQLWRTVVCIAPTVAAMAQSITRVRDNRHTPVDVIGGLIIGFGAAYYGYFTQYPTFSNRFCGRPKNRKARVEGDWTGMVADY